MFTSWKVNKEMKKLENQQKAQDQLNQLTATLKSIDKIIEEFTDDARACLMNNDEAGYELLANSIYYFMDIQKMIQTIKVQFHTYIKTAQLYDTIEGLRPILKNAAKMMDDMPSLEKNSRDFMKFKRSLLRGQLNMKAMSSMMTSVNPATQASRSREDLDILKDKIMMGAKGPMSSMSTATATDTSRTAQNEDFFAAING